MKKLLVLTIVALVSMFFTYRYSAGYKVGDTVQNFEAKNVDGKMVGLKDFPNAEGFVIVFTCNSCPVAQAYEDRINKLGNKLDDQKWPLIAINSNDKTISPGDAFDKMQERAKSHKYTFPYLHDDSQSILNQFGASKTPHFYVLDKNKTVKYIGALDDSDDASDVSKKYVENAISAIKAGKNPNPDFTRAIGCGIKKRTA